MTQTETAAWWASDRVFDTKLGASIGVREMLAETEQAKDRRESLEWLAPATNGSQESSNLELAAVIRGLTQLIGKSEYPLIDRILRSFQPGQTSPAMNLAVLRTTGSVRSKLKAWHDLVPRVRFDLQGRGLDADRLLRGLL